MEFHCLASFGSVHFSLLGVVEWCTFTGIPPFMPWNTCFKSAPFQAKVWTSIHSITKWHSLFETSSPVYTILGLATFIPRFFFFFFFIEECIRVTKFRIGDTFDALGAIFRPGINCPLAILWNYQDSQIPCHFGPSVSPCFTCSRSRSLRWFSVCFSMASFPLQIEQFRVPFFSTLSRGLHTFLLPGTHATVGTP